MDAECCVRCGCQNFQREPGKVAEGAGVLVKKNGRWRECRMIPLGDCEFVAKHCVGFDQLVRSLFSRSARKSSITLWMSSLAFRNSSVMIWMSMVGLVGSRWLWQ